MSESSPVRVMIEAAPISKLEEDGYIMIDLVRLSSLSEYLLGILHGYMKQSLNLRF
jgi:hypothetical protein